MNNFTLLNSVSQILQNSLVSILKDCHQSALWIGNIGETPVTAMAIYETKKEVLLRIKINQVEMSTLDIQISPETVLIKGYWSISENVQGYFRPSQFQSLIPLPYCINPETAIAELEPNILQIRFPLPEKVQSSKVKLALQQRTPTNLKI
jgi:HSP20 family molecular chaperone IbpA